MIKNFIENRYQQKIAIILEFSKKPKGLVFVMHGLSGDKKQPHIQIFAEAFLEKGFNVVRFDTTNSFGASDGVFRKATLTNYYSDLEDVINWAKKQAWYQEPFILTGHSLGAFCAAFYAENHPQEVKALAPISPVVSGKLSFEAHKLYNAKSFEKWQETGWLIEESKSRLGLIKKLPWSHMEDRLKYNLLAKANKLTMPVLLIVGQEDISTPVNHVKKLYNLLPGKKELHIINKATHYLNTPGCLKQVKRIFLNWIDKIDSAKTA